MAIDLGTGSARALVFDRDGQPVGSANREWSHSEVPGVEGSQVFDTRANWRLVGACTRGALAAAELEPDAIEAVAASSMREGIVLFDADGKELWACPNVDARASTQALELVTSGRAERIYELAGDWVAITSPARLMWLRDHRPEVLERATQLGMLSDWAVFRLTGRLVTEASAGSSSGMFDLAARSWSGEISEMIELDPAILPEVVASGAVVGEVSRAATEVTGLRAGTPVVAGGADTQLALVGMGPAGRDTATVIGGSFWQATAVIDDPLIDPDARLRTLCHSEPGHWMIEGIGFYSGLALRWFRDAFYSVGTPGATGTDDAYGRMEAAAAQVPVGAGGVVAILSNVMNARRWVHASPSFLQLSMDSSDPSGPGHCVRALQEAAAYAARRHLEIIEEIRGVGVGRVRFTGGASRGNLWPQILADALGVPVEVPAVTESTSSGAAAYAAVGAGWAPEASEAFQRPAAPSRVVEPESSAVAAYQDHYERWRELYPRALELVEDGLLKPMWWPAGVERPASSLGDHRQQGATNA